jgi:hypothetical protein
MRLVGSRSKPVLVSFISSAAVDLVTLPSAGEVAAVVEGACIGSSPPPAGATCVDSWGVTEVWGTSITSRFVFSRAHVVTVNAHLGSRSAGICPYLPAAKRLVPITGAGLTCGGGTQIIDQRSKSGCATPVRWSPLEVDDITLRIYDRHGHLIKTVPHQP